MRFGTQAWAGTPEQNKLVRNHKERESFHTTPPDNSLVACGDSLQNESMINKSIISRGQSLANTRSSSGNGAKIILGVDPGTLATGFGVVESHQNKLRVLHYDVVKNRSDRSMPIRLKAIYSALCTVIERFHPDEFAIETAFYGKNIQSALKIGHARGVAILAAVNYEIPTAEYSPREVKKSVVGNGAASKDQVQYMVRTLLHLRETPKFYDATDALAVAICHILRSSAPRAVRLGSKNGKSMSWKSFVESHPQRIKHSPREIVFRTNP